MLLYIQYYSKVTVMIQLEKAVSVLITEYFLSTYSPHSYGNQFLAEAYGMVMTLSDSLARAGVNIVLTVSKHLIDFVKYKDIVIVNDEDRYLETLDLLKDQVDYVIAIAPPVELVVIADIVGDKLLGPSINAIKKLSNKYTATTTLRECGLEVPETIICRNSSECYFNDLLRQPVVIKPSMSAGAEYTYVAKDVDEARKLIDFVSRQDPNGYAVIQKYIEGVHGSISAIFSSNTLQIFSLNLQLVGSENGKIVYYGNILPIIRSKPRISQALEIIRRLSSCLGDLNGYIGLDVVWNDNGMYIIEVNPRFTTSGVGMAKIYPELGKTMLNITKPRHIYLGEETLKYVYIVKKANNESCRDVSMCINGLVCDVVDSINDAIKAILSLNPSAVSHLLYDIKLISN